MTDYLVWIDCEMTGLDLRRDALVEVAALVTDPDLNVLGDGVDVVIHASDEVLDSMNEVVSRMHATSGLTEAVRASTITVEQAEEMVLEYVRKFVPDPRTAPLCGNSIATDRGFIARDMPKLDAHLHYRMIDVSSVKELCRRWYPRTYYGQPSKGLAHRALADIKESIRELEYYRRTIFVPPPGLDVEQSKAIAADLMGGTPPEPPEPGGLGGAQPAPPGPEGSGRTPAEPSDPEGSGRTPPESPESDGAGRPADAT